MKLTLPRLPKFSFRNWNNKNKNDYAYIGNVSDLNTLALDSTAIVLGELVIMNIDEAPQEGGLEYVAQPTRQSRRKDISLRALQDNATQIYSSIHPDFAHHIATTGKHTRYILAVDAMIALANKHKKTKTLLICNGYETPDQTYFDTYLFRHSQLIRITEAIIKPPTHMRYTVDVREQLQEALTECPDAHILWTPPLTPLNIDGFQLESTNPTIYSAKFPPVTHDGQTKQPSSKIPAIATVATIALCIGWASIDASTLNQKRTQYQSLTSNSTATPTIDLEMLQARAKWQTEIDASTPEKDLWPANTLLTAIAEHPVWKVISLSIAKPPGTDETGTTAPAQTDISPLSIVLTTPLPSSQAPEEYVQPFLATLNQRTGMKLFVRQQNLTTETQNGQLRLTLEVEK